MRGLDCVYIYYRKWKIVWSALLVLVHVPLNCLGHFVQKFRNFIEASIKYGAGFWARGVPVKIRPPACPPAVNGWRMTFVLVPWWLTREGGERCVPDGADAVSFVSRRQGRPAKRGLMMCGGMGWRTILARLYIREQSDFKESDFKEKKYKAGSYILNTFVMYYLHHVCLLLENRLSFFFKTLWTPCVSPSRNWCITY